MNHFKTIKPTLQIYGSPRHLVLWHDQTKQPGALKYCLIQSTFILGQKKTKKDKKILYILVQIDKKAENSEFSLSLSDDY